MNHKYPINNILVSIIPKRIGYIVWFAPLVVAIGIYESINGFNHQGMGALLGGLLLLLFFFLKRFILNRKQKEIEN